MDVLQLDYGGVTRVGLASIRRLSPEFCRLAAGAVAAQLVAGAPAEAVPGGHVWVQPGEAVGPRVCWGKEVQLLKAGRGDGKLKVKEGLVEELEELAVRDLVLACLALED
jgi:hypothetical protein